MYGAPQLSNRDKGRKFREPLSSRAKYMQKLPLRTERSCRRTDFWPVTGGRRPLDMTPNGPRVIYISADLFISPRNFSFPRPLRCGICREFQAFAARRPAAARKKGAFQSLLWGSRGPFLRLNYKSRRRDGRGERA